MGKVVGNLNLLTHEEARREGQYYQRRQTSYTPTPPATGTLVATGRPHPRKVVSPLDKTHQNQGLAGPWLPGTQ